MGEICTFCVTDTIRDQLLMQSNCMPQGSSRQAVSESMECFIVPLSAEAKQINKIFISFTAAEVN